MVMACNVPSVTELLDMLLILYLLLFVKWKRRSTLFVFSETGEERCAYKGPLDRAGFASWAIKGAR